jgi:hypothetical protein
MGRDHSSPPRSKPTSTRAAAFLELRPEREPLSQRLQAQTKEMVANTHSPTGRIDLRHQSSSTRCLQRQAGTHGRTRSHRRRWLRDRSRSRLHTGQGPAHGATPIFTFAREHRDQSRGSTEICGLGTWLDVGVRGNDGGDAGSYRHVATANSRD